MQVTIESIDQRMLLEGEQDMVTSINIRLPDGSYIAAVVQPEMAERLLRVATSVGRNLDSESGPSSPAYTEDTELEVFGAEKEAEEQEIDWTQLPDDSLSPQMKVILEEIGAPQVMPASELAGLVDQISERLMMQAAAKTRAGVVDKIKAAAVPGQVQKLQVARPKTVPKDDFGYPMVAQQSDRDPGEVALTGSDEDGVPQL